MADLTYGEKLAYVAGTRRGGRGSTAWSDITDKPTEFPPEAHEHTVDDITDFPSIPAQNCFAISEDMFDLATTATKGVAPYSTSYYYTDITIHADAGVQWVEGGVYVFSLNTKVATSSYRNVRLRIGEDDSWHPLCEYTTSICAGSSYFIKGQTVAFVYKTTYYSYGALHRMYDANSNTYIGTCETAAATAAKTANGTYPWAVLTAGLTAPIIFRYANTAKSGVTLNWNSKGAKELWLNGAAISADNYNIPVGTWNCYYDGEKWHVRTDGQHANPALNVTVPTEDISANTAARHTHSNQTVIDSISEDDVAAWNAKQEAITLGEGLYYNDEGLLVSKSLKPAAFNGTSIILSGSTPATFDEMWQLLTHSTSNTQLPKTNVYLRHSSYGDIYWLSKFGYYTSTGARFIKWTNCDRKNMYVVTWHETDGISEATFNLQPKLTAGTGISIDADTNTISTTGGGSSYDDTELRGRIETIEGKESGWDGKQDALGFTPATADHNHSGVYQPAGSYAAADHSHTAAEVGALPSTTTALKNPQKITFTGASSATYDGSSAVTVNIPTQTSVTVTPVVTEGTLIATINGVSIFAPTVAEYVWEW